MQEVCRAFAAAKSGGIQAGYEKGHASDTVLLWGGGSINAKMILTYYITGFPMDCIHAFATVFFLYIAAEPMLEKLDRIKVKYGLVE